MSRAQAECVDWNTLAAFAEGLVDEGQRGRIEEHLARCNHCRAAVARAAAVSLSLGDQSGVGAAGDADAEVLSPGTRVGRYVIERLVGRGGMGAVYAANDPDLNRRVAVKVLRAETLSEEARAQMRARLLREAQAMARLSHPEVIVVYDVGTLGDQLFVAMEYVDAGTLRQWRATRERSVAEILAIYERAGSGLAAAHKAGLVHRDFKPDNVLVGSDGRVRVTDFGLARTLAGADAAGPEGEAPVAREGTTNEGHGLATVLTRTGTLLGTPAYMAPEQLGGGGADARSDIFSFCTALYEALYGERPFDGSSLVSLRAAIESNAVRVAPTMTRVPRWARAALLKGIRAAPEQRFASMGELLAALRTGRTKSLRRRIAMAGIAAGSVGLLVAGQAFLRRTPSMTPPSSAPSSAVAVSAASQRHGDWTDQPTPHAPADATPEDLEDYRKAWVAYRDGNAELALSLFQAIGERSPKFGAAALRAALLTVTNNYGALDKGRRPFRVAFDTRDTLDEHDRAMLDALQPAYFDSSPSRVEETVARLRAAVARAGGAELASALADVLQMLGRFDEALPYAQLALESSPAFARAYDSASISMLYLGRWTEEEELLDRCLQRFPTAASCAMQRTYMLSHQGRCNDLAREAERPALESSWWRLWVLLNSGASGDVLRERLALARPRMEPGGWARLDTALRLRLALRDGDFDAAEAAEGAAEDALSLSETRGHHGLLALVATNAALEHGDFRLAARRAHAYLSRRRAWNKKIVVDDGAMADDPVGPLIGVLREVGESESGDQEGELARYREEYETLGGLYRPVVWMMGWAAAAVSPAEANRALDALPGYEHGQALPEAITFSIPYAYVGRAYQLAGRLEEAVPHLRHAARSCDMDVDPVTVTRAALWWGESLQALARVSEACEAYAIVLRRWGHAKPRSVTADAARAHARTLGCPPP
jgi:serine/threonine-protein kinase